jgi:hypothetical protein
LERTLQHPDKLGRFFSSVCNARKAKKEEPRASISFNPGNEIHSEMAMEGRPNGIGEQYKDILLLLLMAQSLQKPLAGVVNFLAPSTPVN